MGGKMTKKIYITAIIIFIIDQISKVIISSYIGLNSSVRIIKNFFYLTYTNNTGASFGILKNSRVLLIVLSIIALVILLRYISTFKETKYNILGLGFLMGGIIGNLLDRVLFGYVRDFLNFYIIGYDFPVFNIADIFIVLGVFILIISILKGEDSNGSNSRK